jgi:primosomal protein N' (replication factor Y)
LSYGQVTVYLQAVSETALGGTSSWCLKLPLPQTVHRFPAVFQGRLIHQLSEGERYDTWRRARLGELSVIVGPRSALFSPLQRIGLIVVDRHSAIYYQSDTYDTRPGSSGALRITVRRSLPAGFSDTGCPQPVSCGTR